MKYRWKISNLDGILAETVDLLLITPMKMIPSDREFNSASDTTKFTMSKNSSVNFYTNYRWKISNFDGILGEILDFFLIIPLKITASDREFNFASNTTEFGMSKNSSVDL